MYLFSVIRHDVSNITFQDITEPIDGVHAYRLIVSQSVEQGFRYLVIINQRILGNAFSAHCLPQLVVIIHVQPFSLLYYYKFIVIMSINGMSIFRQ